jgi:hypothetical protein
VDQPFSFNVYESAKRAVAASAGLSSPSPSGARHVTYDPNVLAQLNTLFPNEMEAEVDRARFANNGLSPTDEQLSDIQDRVLGRNSLALHNEALRLAGYTVDLTGVPSNYVKMLNDTGLTAPQLAEMAQRVYPNDDKLTAITKWQRAAARMPTNPAFDLYHGDDGGNYVPGKSRPVEGG